MEELRIAPQQIGTQTMHFSEKALADLESEHLTVSEKFIGLSEGYLSRSYKNAQAREYAAQGFLRRLNILVRCIDRIFEILPPTRRDLPTTDELLDAGINLQAFVFNVFGCVDNLAWIWVEEKELAKTSGAGNGDGWVGLGKKKLVRRSLSPQFRDHLNGLNRWFDYQENFRHALAHKIPLYVPPYVVAPDKYARYTELEKRMAKAEQQRDEAEYKSLAAEHAALTEFIPYMTHSFIQKADFILFHGQVMADFNTVIELGQKMLEELDREIPIS